MRPELIDIELPSRAGIPDEDIGVMRPHQAGAAVLVGAGGFGLAMTLASDALSRRQRVAGALTAGTATAFGAFGMWRPDRFARMVRALPPVALPLLSLSGLAASSPQSSPLYFPTVVLTAVGAGSGLNERTSARLGEIVGGLYLAVVAISARRRLGDPGLRWNLGMFSAFRAAGVTGARVGGIAFGVRALARARMRDREAVGDSARAGDVLAPLAAQVAQIAAELDRRLLEAAGAEYGERTGETRRLIAEARNGAHHLEIAPLLIAAARGESLDLAAALTRMVDSYRQISPGRTTAIELDVRCPVDLAIDPRSTGALVVVLKRCLDNAFVHGRDLTSVAAILTADAEWAVLEVEDDGGGEPSPEHEWGLGLGESLAGCRDLGGSLQVDRGRHGLRVRARVPRAPRETAARRDAQAVTRLTDGIARAVNTELARATVWQGVASLLSGRSLRQGVRGATAFALFAHCDRWLARQSRTHPLRGVFVALASGLWPRGARPADGWIGAVLADLAVERRSTPYVEASVATVALGIGAWRGRGALERGIVAEKLLFPLLCACYGLAVVRLRDALAGVEAETVSLRQRANLIESLEEPVQRRHDILSDLKVAGIWRSFFLERADGAAINELAEQLERVTERLRPYLTSPDPVADLQQHLQVRLAPVPVSVSGVQPLLDARRGADDLLRRARAYTGLIVVANAIADDLLVRYPRTLSGRWPLVRLHLELAYQEPDRMVLTLHVESEGARGDAGPDEELRAALTAVGGELLRRDDRALVVALPVHALGRTAA